MNMDWMMMIAPPVIMGCVGYLIGRTWSLKEYLELQEKTAQLEREMSRVTPRGPGGRFTKRKQ
jgi:hypothetical protein